MIAAGHVVSRGGTAIAAIADARDGVVQGGVQLVVLFTRLAAARR